MSRSDVLIIKGSEKELKLIACDSLGGIGPKPGDFLKADIATCAKYTFRVALSEILSLGGKPVAFSLTLSIEPYSFLEQALSAIQEELESASLDPLPFVVSSEKNFPTQQTGLGVTVIGIVDSNALILGKSSEGFSVFLLGSPAVGEEVLSRQSEIADSCDILILRENVFCGDIIPVGSKGVFWELTTLLQDTGLKIHLEGALPVPLYRSCGPATAVLFTTPERKEKISTIIKKPLFEIGTLRRT
ncbi:MAG: hypothetical protein J7J32_04185 [Candidatus Atribacteria bacterium]|nr:hypothetical protein [Candidatus Atribacteria bacterium]MCD6349431.1 hypothetical protein [Candidatus Atribacteria bacterium]